MMVTALSPVIGYDKAAAISYYAIDHDLTLKQAALAKGVSEELFDQVVIPLALTREAPPTCGRRAGGLGERPGRRASARPRPAARGQGGADRLRRRPRGYADWTNPNHRLRRLLASFSAWPG